MLKTVKFHIYQFIRMPVWAFIFLAILVISIVLPGENITGMDVLPGMVYFIMAATLLFSLYGAEESRYEQNNNLIELLSTTSNYLSYIYGKLIYWLILTFAFYIVFFMEITFYVYLMHANVAMNEMVSALTYTFFCWFLPFFFSVIIGYVFYSAYSSLYSYVGIILVWFSTMPYNSLLGFLPTPLSGWLVNGDPNIEQIFGIYDMENQKLNPGFYIQRTYMLILLTCLYLFVKSYKSNVRRAAFTGAVLSLFIPVFSPYVPYISNTQPFQGFSLEEPSPQRLDYEIQDYEMNIVHGRSNHHLSYSVKIRIASRSEHIRLALLDDFKVKTAMFNHTNIAFEQDHNLLSLQLPEKEGILSLDVTTESFASVGPNFFELPATVPWYPMHPNEAVDPYHHAKKETFRITVKGKSPDKVFVNLPFQSQDGTWKGDAYGPTLMYGDFRRENNMIRPEFQTTSDSSRTVEQIRKFVSTFNDELDAEARLPSRIFIVTTIQQFSANPDEGFIYHDRNLNPGRSVLDALYLIRKSGAMDTLLFTSFYFDDISKPAMQNYLATQYGNDFMNIVKSRYAELSDEKKTALIKKWYKQSKGLLTPEMVMEDL